jgi:hypothetical protein
MITSGNRPTALLEFEPQSFHRMAYYPRSQVLLGAPSGSPGTPSAHDNWRARDDSNARTLPQEAPPTSNRAKSSPLPLARVSSIQGAMFIFAPRSTLRNFLCSLFHVTILHRLYEGA